MPGQDRRSHVKLSQNRFGRSGNVIALKEFRYIGALKKKKKEAVFDFGKE